MKRLALRGGNYNNGAGCGLFALNLNNNRTNANGNIGFRPALALIRQKPGTYGVQDGTGAKGTHFLPVADGETSAALVRLVAFW